MLGAWVVLALGANARSASFMPSRSAVQSAEFEREAAFHGLVKSRTTGQPIAGVEVRGAGLRTNAKTDADGRFRLDGVSSPATYSLFAAGYRRRSFEVDDRHATSAEAEIFRLERAARMEIVIYDEGNRPLRGARVTLRRGEYGPLTRGALISALDAEWSLTTDGNGRCRFMDLPADHELRASIHQDGRLLREIEWPFAVDANEQLSVGWVVDRGRDRRGRLVSAEGDALSGVRLWLLANEDGPFERRRPKHMSADDVDVPLRELVTDEHGAFELPDLVHGWYRIGPAPGGEHVPLAIALEHDLRDEATRIDLRAACGTTIKGIVRGSDGNPLAGAVVFAEQSGIAGVLTARCDARGCFELHAAPDATLLLLARDERFGFETSVVELPAGVREVVLNF